MRSKPLQAAYLRAEKRVIDLYEQKDPRMLFGPSVGAVLVQHDDGSTLFFNFAFAEKHDDWWFVFAEHHDIHVYADDEVNIYIAQSGTRYRSMKHED